jgi:thymidylate synthase
MKNYINEDGTPFSKEQFIDKIKSDKEFSDRFGNLGPIYGKQWRRWELQDGYLEDGDFVPNTTIDQIANLINDLKTNPDSRRLLVSAWNPADLPNQVLPPCHYGFQVYTRELSNEEIAFEANKRGFNLKGMTISGKLLIDTKEVKEKNLPTRAISLMWNQRSVDTFLGLPFNIASYGLLLTIIAELVNMVPDELIGNLGDTHLYENHLDQAKEQLTREPMPLPKLNINTEWWPTESGECGEGPLSVDGFFAGLDNNIQHFVRCLIEEDIQLGNYQSHPAIKAKLNN